LRLKKLNNELIKLDVPYFEQTRYSTCGPAALMMVIKYWDDSFELSRKVENKIWLSSNPFIFYGGTLQFGLAKTAKKMGYKVEIFQKTRISEIHGFGIISNSEKRFVNNSNRLKIPIHFGKDILEIIYESLKKEIPPIVFLNLEPIVGENVLHWLVITGKDDGNIFVNDPYVPYGSSDKKKKDYQVNLNTFKKAISTDLIGNLRLPPCLIIVYK
jgi:hypothetical protein